MLDRIVITGINGALAKKTAEYLKKDFEIIGLTTNKKKCNDVDIFYWDPVNNQINESALKNCKHIIHLAGYPILRPWTKKNKALIYKSRVNGANLLFNTCKKLKINPLTFISASAMGIYGSNASGVKSEKDAIESSEWIAKVAQDWEKSAQQFKELSTRIVQMRISLLIDKKSGILQYILFGMKTGVAALIGPKEKIMNWIHIDDAVFFIKESLLNNNYEGAFNLSVEKQTTQIEFIKSIKKSLNSYSIIIKIPSFILRFILGERNSIINTNFFLDVSKLKNIGFKFKFKSIDQVIKKTLMLFVCFIFLTACSNNKTQDYFKPNEIEKKDTIKIKRIKIKTH